jgi:hypothetical protein
MYVSSQGHTYLFDVGHFWPQLLDLRLFRKVVVHVRFPGGCNFKFILHLVVYDRRRCDRKLVYGGWGNYHGLHERGVGREWMLSV